MSIAPCRRNVRVVGLLLTLSIFAPGSPPLAGDAEIARAQEDPKIVRVDPNRREEWIEQAGLHPRVEYDWPYATGPIYGRVDSSERWSPGVLHTFVGSFRLDDPSLEFPEALRTINKLHVSDSQYFIAQFSTEMISGPDARALLAEVEARGGAVMQPMPVTAFLVRLNASAHDVLQGAPGLIALEPYHPAFKLHPSIGRIPLEDADRARSEIYELEILLFPGEDPEKVAKDVSALGGRITAVRSVLVRAEVHPSRLADLAALEPVRLIIEYVPASLHAEETTTTIQTGNHNNGATPFHDAGVDGGGGHYYGYQTLMVLDSGMHLDGADLSHTSVDPGAPGPEHRKVVAYESTTDFSRPGFVGQGDDVDCNVVEKSSFSHGHMVSATALGNATDVDPAYGPGTFFRDGNNVPWRIDGVAPKAKLVMYDAMVTPADGGCTGGLKPGVLYDLFNPLTSSLPHAYDTYSATMYNLSWGYPFNNSYGGHPEQIDDFLQNYRSAMVFVAAGNEGAIYQNGVPWPGTISKPATAKNAVAVGASVGTVGHVDPDRVNERAFFSSVGPALCGLGDYDCVGRIAPLLMAPGRDNGGLGLESEYCCRTSDIDHNAPVECDLISSKSGTSFSTPAVAGAGLLIRDYFAQGFHPDGAREEVGPDPDHVGDISGALVKSILISSAEFLGRNFGGLQNGPTDYLTIRHRFNREQGYGRVQLDKALPLRNWQAGATGLLVVDGGIPFGHKDLDMEEFVNAWNGGFEQATFNVCDPDSELRVALSWMEDQSPTLLNNLNLELISPSGKTYYGNYFTEDDDRNGELDLNGEDCPDFSGAGGGLDESAWSLPVCQRNDASLPPRDGINPTEAIFLSPDPDGDGDTTDGLSQIEVGPWSVIVESPGGGVDNQQRYALAIAGAACQGAAVRFDRNRYECNGTAAVTVMEQDEPGIDPTAGLTVAEIESRVTVQVLDLDGEPVDEETGITFIQPVVGQLKFVGQDLPLFWTGLPEHGNGLLDVQHGYSIKVLYADEVGGVPDESRLRVATAPIDCQARIEFGDKIPRIGADGHSRVIGGCERNDRDTFEFGYPDRYMDAGETIRYQFSFSTHEIDLLDAEVSLRCVLVDADSPEDCRPGSVDCIDPDRQNNPPCGGLMTILDTPKRLPRIPVGESIAVNFSIVMADAIVNKRKVEMVLGISSDASGKNISGLLVDRQTLNADERSFYYSTDHPTGGWEVRDIQNNEIIENPTEVTFGMFEDYRLDENDYRFETLTFSDMTSTGRNTHLLSPWNFDGNSGGFTSGLGASTREDLLTDILAQWGEDLNFNNLLDPGEDRDPPNAMLDQSWSTTGGCGWQTRPPHFCVGDNTRGCFGNDDCKGTCRVPANDAVSTLDPCVAPPGCPATKQCSPASAVNPLGPCDEDEDCDGVFGSCQAVAQACVGFDGLCNGGSTMATGGVWHTGAIGGLAGQCEGTPGVAGQCQQFETINSENGQLVRTELLLTPVMQKVNQQLDADGDPLFTAEILRWAWNQALDLPDPYVAVTWEFDTDVSRAAPVTLTEDSSYLGTLKGPYGPKDGTGVPGTTRGWSMFAPIDPVTLNSSNGTSGGNREGRNSCFFTGPLALSAAALANDGAALGLAGPPDDDLNNGYCEFRPHVSCAWVCANAPFEHCNVNADCAGGGLCVDDDPDCQGDDCIRANGAIDENVKARGPIRNMDLGAGGGPDMRFNTLEDLYGDTGNTFQAAIGMINYESRGDPYPKLGYGLAIDDMVVEWREYDLLEDVTECAAFCNGDPATPCVDDGDCAVDDTCGGGSCAIVMLESTKIYGRGEPLEITVLERTPSRNDCNDDGDRSDPWDDFDCDDDGTLDVVIEATSVAEGGWELLVLNQAGHPGYYRGELPISATANIPGMLYVDAGDEEGAQVVVRYQDIDDGSGSFCRTSLHPLASGYVQTTGTVFLVSGEVVVTGVTLVDINGDADGWADNGETVQMWVDVSNKTGQDLTDVRLRLSTSSPYIDCIVGTVSYLGDLPKNETLTIADPFTFVVGNVRRTTMEEDLSAEFTVGVSADQFSATARPQKVVLDLDLDVSGGEVPWMFEEHFEDETGFGEFAEVLLDEGLSGSNEVSDGYRCQYHDPGESNLNGQECALNPTGADEASYWQTTTDRAFVGDRSAYFGIPLDSERGFTTPLAQLEAIATTDPINLGWDKVCEISRLQPCASSPECPGDEECVRMRPELYFKHQISLVDWRTLDTGGLRTADRAVIQVQLADEFGDPLGADRWITIEPYNNIYDTQASWAVDGCMFDPIDDLSVEDDRYNDEDPSSILGPSSTCYEKHTFAYQGDTDEAFHASRVGNASDGPGLRGVTDDDGTWVEPRFDLERFRGRRIRIRFLVTTHKRDAIVDYEEMLRHNPDPGDDGWFIDEVTVSDTLLTAATVVPENTDNATLRACGPVCNEVIADLTSDAPLDTLSAPGQQVELSAAGSYADRCADGLLQYRFWIDGDGQHGPEHDGDTSLSGWTDSPLVTNAPVSSTTYELDVRCSSATECADSTWLTVDVTEVPNLCEPIFQEIRASEDGTLLYWDLPQWNYFVRGELWSLSSYAIEAEGENPSWADLDISFPTPGEEEGFWYLLRSALECEIGSWGSGGPGEKEGRDAALP